MPTESAFLLAGLLFIAAALGYLFARFGETENDTQSGAPRGTDYLKGLNYVLDADSDRALEVFARLAESDADALETHFALGTLFRKRGEVDRAIRVHQNIMARPGLDRSNRAQAEYALAEDYMSAGLLDRAETLYMQLRESTDYRARALGRLMRIFELTREWDRAIEAHDELERYAPVNPQVGSVAHYYCELAEQALLVKDFARAREMLKRADASRHRTVRSTLIRADLARDTDQWREAVRLYRRVAEEAPELLREVLQRLGGGSRAEGEGENFSRFLRKLMEDDESAVAAIAMTAIIDPNMDEPAAFEALEQFIGADPALRELVGLESISQSEPAQRISQLDRLRGVLRRLVAGGPGYRCRNCGYASVIRHWQCPSCRNWETIQPVNRVLVTGLD